MLLIFGLMLLQTAACLDQFCRIYRVYPINQCYAALGHKLILQMDLSPSYENYLYKTLNDGSRLEVFSIIKNKEHKHESIRYRSDVFFDNMTLIINKVTSADSGTYQLNVIVTDMLMSSHFELNVEAPIGSVEVSVNCSSSGVMRVFCSSEGDQLLYNWTLNGDPLKHGNSSIDLDEETDGNISCSVKNHVSHAQNTIRLQPCPAVSVVFVLVWCLQMMLLLGLLGSSHIYMRHTSGKKQEDQKVRMRRFREDS